MKLTAVLNERSGATADCSAGLNGRRRLHAHQHVKNQQPTGVEQQHANCVGDRVLLAVLVDAGHLVDCDFDRPQNRGQECAIS